MTEFLVDYVSETILFPATAEPPWGKDVQRWYQLDAPAFSLVEFYSRHRERLGEPKFIFLASTDGSNETDWSFAATGATKANKFVHTLPNIRLSPLLELTRWRVPTLCYQSGDRNWAAALVDLADGVGPLPGWILGVGPGNGTGKGEYLVHWAGVRPSDGLYKPREGAIRRFVHLNKNPDLGPGPNVPGEAPTEDSIPFPKVRPYLLGMPRDREVWEYLGETLTGERNPAFRLSSCWVLT